MMEEDLTVTLQRLVGALAPRVVQKRGAVDTGNRIADAGLQAEQIRPHGRDAVVRGRRRLSSHDAGPGHARSRAC